MRLLHEETEHRNMARTSSKRATLSIDALCTAARAFADSQTCRDEPKLYGVTDGKAVGTYLEGKFIKLLARRFSFQTGNAAKGIDLPELQVDIKTTSIKQPQSSSPFTSAGQKVFGLGYSLLVFVYEKRDNQSRATARLSIRHVVFVEKQRTADYQTTRGLLQVLDHDGNEEDLVAFMRDRMLPADDIELQRIAKAVLRGRIQLGYLTISNALQWRLQYRRVIDHAGGVEGIIRIR